jgi:hypothetical protein
MEMMASKRKTLGLLGPLDPSTHGIWHTTSSKVSKTLSDIMGHMCDVTGYMGDIMGLPSTTPC